MIETRLRPARAIAAVVLCVCLTSACVTTRAKQLDERASGCSGARIVEETDTRVGVEHEARGAVDEVVFFSRDDAEYSRATARARATLDVFQELYRADPDAIPDVKVAIPYGDNNFEHMWLQVESFRDGVVSGLMKSTGIYVPYCRGDPYSASTDNISDWMVVVPPRDGGETKIHGAFTYRISIDRGVVEPDPDFGRALQPLP